MEYLCDIVLLNATIIALSQMMVLFDVFLIANKSHKKTKTNNALVRLSELYDFLSVVLSQSLLVPTEAINANIVLLFCKRLRNFLKKLGTVIFNKRNNT